MMQLYRRVSNSRARDTECYRIGFISRWLRIREHISMMTVLVERWDSRTCTFHLPTREAIVTLLDVWRILKIPICSMIPEYRLDTIDFYL